LNEAEWLTLLYEENGRVAATFWEWRHKVILLFGAMLTTMLVIVSWMYERRLGAVIAIPFALGSLVALACRVFDHRNEEIIHQCFRTASAIEEKLKLNTGIPAGVYSRIIGTRSQGRTYSKTLRIGYTATAGALALCATAVVILGVVDPSLLRPKH
jgi:hypothetical protein